MIMVVTKRIWDLSHPKHLLNTVGPQHSSTYSRPGFQCPCSWASRLEVLCWEADWIQKCLWRLDGKLPRGFNRN